MCKLACEQSDIQVNSLADKSKFNLWIKTKDTLKSKKLLFYDALIAEIRLAVK